MQIAPSPLARPGLRVAAAAVLALSAQFANAADSPAVPAPAPKAGAAAAAVSARAPDASERGAMLEILRAEPAPERAAWLTFGAGNPETAALADGLASVFRDAGWKVEAKSLSGMVLKPGVSILIADEQPPAWTATAVRAMEASGVAVKSATGYRPYYEDKKKENPAWPGVPLEAGQALVIVLGPEPKI